MNATGRARSTAVKYLCEMIERHEGGPQDRWVDADVAARIRDAATLHGLDLLSPIKETLGEEVSYDDIHIVVTYMRTERASMRA